MLNILRAAPRPLLDEWAMPPLPQEEALIWPTATGKTAVPPPSPPTPAAAEPPPIPTIEPPPPTTSTAEPPPAIPSGSGMATGSGTAPTDASGSSATPADSTTATDTSTAPLDGAALAALVEKLLAGLPGPAEGEPAPETDPTPLITEIYAAEKDAKAWLLTFIAEVGDGGGPDTAFDADGAGEAGAGDGGWSF